MSVPDYLVRQGNFMITEAEYTVRLARLFSWKVATVTEGFDLEISFPSLSLEHEVETFLWEKPSFLQRQVPARAGMIQLCYNSDRRMLPESGLALEI